MTQEASNYEKGLATASNATVVNLLVKKLEEVTVKIEVAQSRLDTLQKQVKRSSTFSLDGLDMTNKSDREKARDIISEHVQDIIIDLHKKTVDVTLRNGNAVLNFGLEHPEYNNIKITRALYGDDFTKEIDDLVGFSGGWVFQSKNK